MARCSSGMLFLSMMDAPRPRTHHEGVVRAHYACAIRIMHTVHEPLRYRATERQQRSSSYVGGMCTKAPPLARGRGSCVAQLALAAASRFALRLPRGAGAALAGAALRFSRYRTGES